MLSIRRPSLLNRSLTTPPLTPTNAHAEANPMEINLSINLATPPLSPRHSRSSSDLSKLDDIMALPTESGPLNGKRKPRADPVATDTVAQSGQHPNGALICPFGVDVLQDGHGRSQMFGSGVWSNVFKATPAKPRTRTNSIGLPTPPSSPTSSMPILVAVKKPARPDAKPILDNEAAILSYLNRLSSSKVFVVPFYGVIEADSSLVLGAIPLSLEDHVRRCATSAQKSLTTNNMSVPVVGSTKTWLNLAWRLVSALAWLHDRAGVVHGDIKPSNFLLEPCSIAEADDFPFRPMFIDFSSSHRVNQSEGEVPAGTLSAVTREYTAPELLKSSVLRDPKSTATKLSDVFSLAITLLVCATGNTMVYSGSVYQRQAMATQGWQAISLVRCGADGARLPRQGIVERALDAAVLKHDMGRTSAAQWLERVVGLQRGEPTKVR